MWNFQHSWDSHLASIGRIDIKASRQAKGVSRQFKFWHFISNWSQYFSRQTLGAFRKSYKKWESAHESRQKLLIIHTHFNEHKAPHKYLSSRYGCITQAIFDLVERVQVVWVDSARVALKSFILQKNISFFPYFSMKNFVRHKRGSSFTFGKLVYFAQYANSKRLFHHFVIHQTISEKLSVKIFFCKKIMESISKTYFSSSQYGVHNHFRIESAFSTPKNSQVFKFQKRSITSPISIPFYFCRNVCLCHRCLHKIFYFWQSLWF